MDFQPTSEQLAHSYQQPVPLLTDIQVIKICALADQYAMAKARAEKLRDTAKRMGTPFSELKKPVNRARQSLFNYLKAL